MIIMNEIDFEECLKDSPAYRYVHRSMKEHMISSFSPSVYDIIIFLQESTSTSHDSYRYVRRSFRTGWYRIDWKENKWIISFFQMSKSCNSVINSGKTFIQEFQYHFYKSSSHLSSINFFRKFLKCIYDVGELFSSDDITYKNLVKFYDYLREIQGLFSVNDIDSC